MRPRCCRQVIAEARASPSPRALDTCSSSRATPTKGPASRARDASGSDARERVVHARQGARHAGSRCRRRSGLRALLRVVAGAPPDGACGRASQGRASEGGRTALSTRPQATSAQRRCDAPARFDCSKGRACRRGGTAPRARDLRGARFHSSAPGSWALAQGAGPVCRGARVFRSRNRS